MHEKNQGHTLSVKHEIILKIFHGSKCIIPN